MRNSRRNLAELYLENAYLKTLLPSLFGRREAVEDVGSCTTARISQTATGKKFTNSKLGTCLEQRRRIRNSKQFQMEKSQFCNVQILALFFWRKPRKELL